MSNLLAHAEDELRRVGLFDKESDYGGAIGLAVMEIMKVFAEQGHSGFSASMVTQLCERLMRFEPLSPLTGEDDEWIEYGAELFQNRRCSHVFKDKECGVYDAQGYVFREPNGVCYRNSESHRPVTFPYVPKTEYVDVDENGRRLP